MASREKGQPYEGMERDPCPPGGYPPVKRRPNLESDFQENHWPKSKIKAIQTINKGRAQEKFGLTSDDMCDLYHRRTEGPAKGTNRIVIWKLYFAIQCERRGWEIHGGPQGLAYAKRSQDWNRAYRARTSGSNVSPSQGTSTVASGSTVGKSRTQSTRPKGLRLDSSAHDVNENTRGLQEMEIKSEDDSSWDLIPSTPQRKRVFASSPKKRGHADDQGSVATPQKRFKASSKGDDKVPFQLPTPVSTVKKSSLVSAKLTREGSLELHDSDDGDCLPSLLPIKRSKSRNIQAVPATPRKRDIDDGLPLLPTPSSSHKNRPQREFLGTLDCDWGSDDEVRVSWIS